MIKLRRVSAVWDICNIKTIFFNFKYLPFKQAIKFPILVSRRVRVRCAQGSITIKSKIYPGMIRLGMDSCGIFDNKRSRSIWQVRGGVLFEGSCFIGHGSKISVAEGAILSFGNNFTCTAETSIAAVKSISFGSGCMLSWDILVMDTDWHTITDYNNNVINAPKSIVIGNNVWIGCRSIIMKGVNIAAGTVVAAGSIITKDVLEQNCIIGKNPIQVIKRNVLWER